MLLRGTIVALALAAALAGAVGAQDRLEDDVVILDNAEGEGEIVHVRGWLELARVQPADLLMRAKLDSGALTSALHAEILRGPEGYGFPTRLDDEEHIDVAAADSDAEHTVVFALESRRGRRVVFEREIVRWVRIKERDGGTTARPVVELGFCVGGVPMHGEVGLTDRGDFNYPLLIGRRMLTEAKVLVASWETFTHESRCYPDGARPNLD